MPADDRTLASRQAGHQLEAVEVRTAALAALARRSCMPVLIIGAGITGCGLFRDLALQGIDCLIIDKADFCSGSSATPSRLIHGGVQYIESRELRLAARSTLERNLMLRNAPHFVRPLQSVLLVHSIFGGIWPSMLRLFGRKATLTHRGAVVVKLGLTLYDFLCASHRMMPHHRLVSR